MTTRDENGHEWVTGRFQSDDERECRRCRLPSDDPGADQLCKANFREAK